MSESQMWGALRKHVFVGEGVHAQRIESPMTGVGIPDVNYSIRGDFSPKGVHDWMELKHADEWPKRGGPLRLEHYTQEQKIWHRKRSGAGGTVWVLLQVADDWLLFDWRAAYAVLGRQPKDILIQWSTHYWPQRPTREELLGALTCGRS